MNIYIVTGGIGKHVIFSSMIEKLYEKHDGKISIVSAYPDIFKFHPNVEKSVSFDEPGFYDEYIIGKNANIYYTEPYFSNYVKGKMHITKAWSGLFDISADILPDIYIDDYSLEEANRFKKTNGDFIITQFSGGQSPININPNVPFKSIGQQRSYPRHLAQEVVNKIKKIYPKMAILNYTLPNEETSNLDGTISISAPYLFYVTLCQMCRSYITIDSSLLHFAANKWNKKIGVSIWGSTGPKQLGYDKNINLTNNNGIHDIRPLTKSLGDIFNADGSVWEQKRDDLVNVNTEEIINALEYTIDYNDEIDDTTFKNVVVNKNRKENVIELNDDLTDVFIELNDKILKLKSQTTQLIDGIAKKHGKDGKFTLSEDGKRLLKIG